MTKRQKLPKIPPGPPAPPPPPPTRAEIRERYVRYVTNERDGAKEDIDAWRSEFAMIGKKPPREGFRDVPEGCALLNAFAWGQGAVETAARYRVTDDICAALLTGISLEDLRDQVVHDALAKARWGSRSSSVLDELCGRAETAALAKEAETLISWCKQKTAESEHAPICSKE